MDGYGKQKYCHEKETHKLIGKMPNEVYEDASVYENALNM